MSTLMVKYHYKSFKEVTFMLESIFAFVESILAGAGVGGDASGIVAQVFEFILGIFGK